MLDKITKACYNLLAFFFVFAIFNKEMLLLLLFLVKLLN